MVSYVQQNASWLVLVLAGAALLLVLVQMWRKKGRKDKLERDRCGYWRYHKETQFILKAAYGKQLDRDRREAAKQESGSSSSKERGSKKKEPPAVAVLTFDGDIRAKQREPFARMVDEVAVNRRRIREIVVRIESQGGMVAPYGHVYSEMERLRSLELPLTVCIDVIAASGGYLAALPATKILAAPFAIVGSVGVMAFVPNVRRLLKRWDIDPRTFTAGRYKRTITLTDDATPEEAAHFQQQIEAIQSMFSQAVAKYRPNASLDLITTGDHWTAADTVEQQLGMVDELSTSHDYLLKLNRDIDVLYINEKKGLFDDGLLRFVTGFADQIEQRLISFMRGS